MKPIEPHRWQQVRELFDTALGLDAAERTSFLEKIGREDATLRRQVESLVLSAEEGDAFLTDAIAAAGGPSSASRATLAGQRVGPYRVLEEVGAGGMGAVYLAERDDEEFRQRVAIKIARGGVANPELLRRFRSERQILAGLEHPAIARLLDGGSTADGLPYVVMEYVEGRSVDRFCDEERLSIPRRLELFRTVCAAVQYAHQNLVVHRDIKPSNILVATDGTPKLLDFGIAKLLESGASEEEGTVTGPATRLLTPDYASPEQIRGEPISTASDVYSLGVVLYELLTGRRPYELSGSDLLELQRQIAEEEPEPPSRAIARKEHKGAIAEGISRARSTEPERLRRTLTSDLDHIVMKALRKEPARRYGSAAELSEDLRRHLEGLPVSAQKDTFGYRAGKFVRRHRFGVAAAAAFALLVAGFGVTMAVSAARIAEERDLAETHQKLSEQVSVFLQEMLESINPATARGRDTALLSELLYEAASRVDSELGEEPVVAATLHATIGNTFKSIALFDEAEQHLREALSLRRDTYGPRHSDVAASSYDLADLLFETGDYEEAEALLREALAMRRELEGDDATEVPSILVRLGAVLDARQSYEEAEASYREALAIQRRLLGDEHQDVAVSMSNLGYYLTGPRAEGNDEGEQLLRDALDILRKTPEERPLDLAETSIGLANVMRSRERYDEAEPLYRAALEIQRRVLGNTHPDTAVTLNLLASMFEFAESFDVAEPLYREALSVQRVALGNSHRDVGTTVNNLAGLLRKTGRLEEANELYHEAIEVYREALGPDHLWVGIVLCNYADNLQRSGNCSLAEETVEECLRVRRQYWPEEHWRIAMGHSILGNCLRQRGRFAESEEVLLSSLRSVEEQADSRTVRTVLRGLIALYNAWRKPEKAAEYQKRFSELDGADSP